MTDRLINMIGLCMRAGRLQSGALPVEKALAAGKNELLLLDEGMTPGSVKKFENACAANQTACILLPGGALTNAIGKERLCAAVTDEGFAKQILKLAVDAGLHIIGGVVIK